MQTRRKAESNHPRSARPPVPSGGSTSLPFWQYSIFGSGIGASNFIIAPPPAAGEAAQLIMGGNSLGNSGPDDFWQIVQYNPANHNYDQLFVSSIYSGAIARIGMSNLIGDSQPEILVMLENGHIYLYDLNSRL